MPEVNTHGPGADDLHLWWGLSYAQYLTIPRTVMQSMPDEWQGKMAAMLRELDEAIDWRPDNACYFVTLNRLEYDDEQDRREKGAEIEDPLADYERGRRRLLLREPVDA